MRVFEIQQQVSAVASACSAAGAWLALVKEWVAELFGVPLPVFLAAEAGAFGARAFLPAAPFWRAFFVSQLWAIAGTATAQLALWVAAKWLEGGTPPPGALAGVALLIAALGQRFAPILWDRGGAALERRLDTLWKDNKGG